MTELECDLNLEEKIAQANPSPVLSSAADGALQFINQAATKLKQDLELGQVTDLLPSGHAGLVKACLKTGVTLTEECHLGDRRIMWSYQSTDKNDVVYIYGYDATVFQSALSGSKSMPEANPNPVLMYNLAGDIQFKNQAVTLLLNDLGFKEIEEMLPVDHHVLLTYCIRSRVPVTEERQVAGRNITWSYQLSDISDVAYIYGYDITGQHARDLCANALPGVNPNPVLISGPNGLPRYTNPAISQLLLDLGLDKVAKLLPQDHKGLVRACHLTNTALSRQHQIGGKTLVWSYLPVDGSDVVYVYGNDITDYC